MVKASFTWIAVWLAFSTMALSGCGDVNVNWDVPTMEHPEDWSWMEHEDIRDFSDRPLEIDFSLDESFLETRGDML